MAMGTRKDREEQEELWVPHTALPKGASHPFYQRLNQLLEESHFGEFVEGRCQRFYAKKRGRPSLVPGVYFRLLLIGYFEGIDSERGMAWRANDSLALRRFLRVGLEESPPDHSTISRTRRLMDVETHREVFTWVLGVLAESGCSHSSFDPLRARFRSSRANCSRVGVAIPDSCASRFRNSWYPSPVSRRTIVRKAAFASSVVASIPSVCPLSSPFSASTPNTQVNTSRWVSTSINRRVREIVE